MPTTPTTKSQVQAYQFVLRRMQSALVRRDAVMLHDPMRTHTRATVVGVMLGLVGMVGFVIWGLLSPSPTPPNDGIVIGQESGQVYVKTSNPPQLIPTFNLASARLLLMTEKNGSSGPGSSPVPATVVPDEELKNIPRGRLTGIPDGPPLLPDHNQRISDNWAVCDQIGLDPSLPDPTSIDKTTVTVLAGVPDLGRELAPNEALLVTADNGKTYLIYRLSADSNQPNANAVRAEIDLGDGAVKSALNLTAKPRHISQGLLNAIPEVPALHVPPVDGAGTTPSYAMGDLPVGAVFSLPVAGDTKYYVMLKNGVQEVSRAVADIIRFQKSFGTDIQPETPDKMRNVKVMVPTDPGYLSVDDYPQQPPIVLDAAHGWPVTCLGWSIVNQPGGRDQHTAVFVGDQVPFPRDANNVPAPSVQIGQPGPDHVRIDSFYMEPGYAAVVQSATSKETFNKGLIQLISDRGIRYGVPDANTALGLGLDDQRPAPDSIIGLLPTGASLNTQDVLRTFDSVPIAPTAGSFPPATSSAAAPPTGGN